MKSFRFMNPMGILSIVVMASLLLPFSQVQAQSSGQLGASTGASCNSCHTGGITPAVSLTGPATVEPGLTYRYTLTMSGGQAARGGANISATGGSLIPVLGLALTNGELHHFRSATADANGVIVWEFDWTAPPVDSTEVINAGVLSANGNFSTVGDAGATTSLTITVGNGGTGGPVVTGESLYIDNCQVCHGPPPGPKAGRTATQIQDAIGINIGGMGALSFLTVEEVQLIADFLSGQPQAPVANAGGPYAGELNIPVAFDGSGSTDADGTIVTYEWDFGDGTTGTGATTSHTYVAEGTYTVTLTVTDNDGSTNSDSTTANIGVPIVFDGVALYGTHCTACHGPLDTSPKAGRTAAQIQGAIDANTGGMGSLSGLIPEEVQAIADALSAVPQAPVANAGGPYSGEVSVPMVFDGSASSDADGTIISYDWDFGDGTTGTGVAPTHTYVTQGNYTVTLMVTDDSGLTNSTTTSANIGVPAVFDGVALYGTHCSACHGPLDTSAKIGRSAAQIQGAIDANTGGMGSLSGLIPEEVQAISDALNALPQPPVAVSGGPYSGEVNVPVAFDGSASSDADGNIVTYDWDFGDGTLGTGATVSHTYAAQGNYSVTLTVTDDSGLTGTATTSANIGVPAVFDGVALYGTNCSACHGPLDTSPKAGRTAAQIQGAIDANVGGMGSLSGLIPEEVQAISDALANVGGGTPTDGKGLYDSFCAACHGPEGKGGLEQAVTGESASAINKAIAEERDMNYLSGLLTAEEVSKIADYLNGREGGGNGTITVTKKSLYDSNCAGCHGPEGRGGIEEGVRRESARNIKRAIANERDMNFLASLSDEVVQAIADYLNGDNNGTIEVPAPPTGGGGTAEGQALYATNCAGCHGNAPGAKAGRTAAQIQAAINGIPAMSGLSGLTAAEIQLIADAIAPATGGGGTGGGGTGGSTALYDANCAACHGAAPGTKAGRTAAQIQAAINAVPAMAGLTGLSTADIQAIADSIATGGAPTPTTPEGLYTSYCAACHGPEGRGGVEEGVRGKSARSIKKAIRNERDMQYLSDLVTDEIINDIASYLNQGR